MRIYFIHQFFCAQCDRFACFRNQCFGQFVVVLMSVWDQSVRRGRRSLSTAAQAELIG